MFDDLDKYIAVFLTGLLVTYLITPAVRKLAVRHGVVDKPDERRPHKHPTARGGGIAVVLGVFAASALALVCNWSSVTASWWQHYFAASILLAVVGVIDDIRGMRAIVKLAGQTLAALLMAMSEDIRFGSFLGFDLPPILDYAVVVFYIVAVINAFNLIDGLDGLASGLAIISATGLCGVFLIGHAHGSVLVLLALIGACLGFLRYNFHPATIFLGDTGSMFLGFTLGVISLQTFNKNTFLLSLTIPLLVLGIPIYDSLLAVWRRSVRMWLPGTNSDGTAKKRGIMQPDVEHLHHRLLKMGLSTRRAATSLYVINIGLVGLGLLLTTFKSHTAGIFLFALMAVVYVFMRRLAVIELQDTGRVILTGLHRPTRSTFKALSYPIWDMLCLTGTMAFIMWMIESVRVDFLHTWFLELPIWVTPTFSLLATSRTYVTVWPRARVLDVMLLVATLQLGLLISLGLALLIDQPNAQQWLVRALVLAGISHPLIISSRVFYRVVEELMSHFRSSSSQKAVERVLLYGAGGRCQLFIKERDFNNSATYDGSVVVGLIDDEPLLGSQWVYGYQVLGTSKDLPNLIARHKINRIIVTATLGADAHAFLREIARQHHLLISEWRFSNDKLNVNHPETLPSILQKNA